MLLKYQVLALHLTLLAGPVLACEIDKVMDGAPVVGCAWARPVLGQSGATALYFEYWDDSIHQPRHLISVTTSIAKHTEIHESKVENGIVTMAPAEHLVLPKNLTRFEPKGKHVMLMGVTLPLTVGDHFTFELNFREGVIRGDAIVSMMPPK